MNFVVSVDQLSKIAHLADDTPEITVACISSAEPDYNPLVKASYEKEERNKRIPFQFAKTELEIHWTSIAV